MGKGPCRAIKYGLNPTPAHGNQIILAPLPRLSLAMKNKSKESQEGEEGAESSRFPHGIFKNYGLFEVINEPGKARLG